MVASPVPIIVYVAPSGARAASAGTYITYASNLAAMAPGTNIGAATPIELGGLPGMPQQPKDKKPDTETTAPQRKSINDMVAMLRSLAQLRSRNVEWAEKAVRDAATLTAPEALKENVIEIVAGSVDDLLAQADGRKVHGGQPGTDVGDQRRNDRHLRARLAHPRAVGNRRPEHRLPSADDRVLRHPARVLESRHVRSRRGRRHQPDPGADRAVGAAGPLWRARVAGPRHRADDRRGADAGLRHSRSRRARGFHRRRHLPVRGRRQRYRDRGVDAAAHRLRADVRRARSSASWAPP